MCCSVLQRVTVCCSVFAVFCIVLQCVAVCCSVLQRFRSPPEVHTGLTTFLIRQKTSLLLRNTVSLQHTATHCNTLQHIARHPIVWVLFATIDTATHCNTVCNTLQRTATHCNTLHHSQSLSSPSVTLHCLCRNIAPSTSVSPSTSASVLRLLTSLSHSLHSLSFTHL